MFRVNSYKQQSSLVSDTQIIMLPGKNSFNIKVKAQQI